MFDEYFRNDKELIEGGKLRLNSSILSSVSPKTKIELYDWVKKNIRRCYEISHLYNDLHYKYGCLDLCLVWDNVAKGFVMIPGIESCNSDILTYISNNRETAYLDKLPKKMWIAVDMSHINDDSVCFSNKKKHRWVWGSSILEDGLVSQILGKRVNEVDPDKHYYLYKYGSSIKVVEAG